MSRKRKTEEEEESDEEEEEEDGETVTTADVIAEPKWLLRIPNEIGEQARLPKSAVMFGSVLHYVGSGENLSQHGGIIMKQFERRGNFPKIKSCRFLSDPRSTIFFSRI